MTLTAEKIDALKDTCKRVRKRTLKFFYCQEAADGDPAIIIGRSIAKDAKAMRRTAKKKKFVHGTVTRENRKLRFVTETPTAAKFPKNLKMFWGSKIPDLKKAVVTSPEELEAAEAERQEQGGEKDNQRAPAHREKAVRLPKELLDAGDSDQVHHLTSKFKDKGMDRANAAHAARATTILQRKGVDAKEAHEQHIAPFALGMANKQVAKLEAALAKLKGVRVEPTVEGITHARSAAHHADNAIRQLYVNTRVYISLARKASPEDVRFAAELQALQGRMGTMMDERENQLKRISADIAKAQGGLRGQPLPQGATKEFTPLPILEREDVEGLIDLGDAEQKGKGAAPPPYMRDRLPRAVKAKMKYPPGDAGADFIRGLNTAAGKRKLLKGAYLAMDRGADVAIKDSVIVLEDPSPTSLLQDSQIKVLADWMIDRGVMKSDCA